MSGIECAIEGWQRCRLIYSHDHWPILKRLSRLRYVSRLMILGISLIAVHLAIVALGNLLLAIEGLARRHRASEGHYNSTIGISSPVVRPVLADCGVVPVQAVATRFEVVRLPTLLWSGGCTTLQKSGCDVKSASIIQSDIIYHVMCCFVAVIVACENEPTQ
jgi:hypothetical protein